MTNDTMTPRKVLVFGATGVIGKYILGELYNARSSFEKIGLFTSAATAKNKSEELSSWKEKGVNVIIGDVDSEDNVNMAYNDYDTIISALGRNAILAQIPLLRLASASPTIHSFFPSEYGTDIEYAPTSATEKPHQLKLEVRRFVRENIQDLKVTYLVTGPYSDLYFGTSPDARVGTFDVQGKRATLLGTGQEKVSFTTMRDVGRLVVAALKTPTTDAERILKVNSFTTSPAHVLSEFERQTSSQWDVTYTPLEELKKLEEDAWKEDAGLKTVFTLRRIWTEGGTLYQSRDNESIGLREGDMETLESQIAKVIGKRG
ncbi:NAD(P)-binding protein [Dothidotthia symphoricarpi CBS 119687]|uniref:NAD(P)-binding protein n=1 Tax=Dothidotthia symphoricarpi CBS 119687 TaxID=1392245 RepID=A0A6A6ACX2_9PLEO|nr:NAD(P)-binding protein [Dothidotthia symphoricarpi CBS 119687]KAF2129752.1 NAD(P)-binding protein [Dothidotthia symphoricarpi CBS 119687]